jgi:hypothetical protein
MQIIGRSDAVRLLERFDSRASAQFLAVYGRRRIGKTYLVENFFKPRAAFYFGITGSREGTIKDQLGYFRVALQNTFYAGAYIPELTSWSNAFDLLAAAIEKEAATRNAAKSTQTAQPTSAVIFLDEAPWLDTHKSGFRSALEQVWNTRLSKVPFVRLIVCGSASSWMIKHLRQARGGLHNRVTETLHLKPFTLGEAQEYIENKHQTTISKDVVLELYLALGGVAYYLDLFDKSLSVRQNISRLVFGNGTLRREFETLFKSLFDDGGHHLKIVEALATKKRGLTRGEIQERTQTAEGSSLTRWLTELEESDFIAKVKVIASTKDDYRWRILDPFTLFHQRWIAPTATGLLSRANEKNYWEVIRTTQPYKIWAGHAFETLVLLHISAVKKVLGIDAIQAEAGPWFTQRPAGRGRPRKSTPTETAGGAEIDLLFDREDSTVSICEIKHHDKPFELTEAVANTIKKKGEIFKSVTRSKKNLQFVLISASGVKPNQYARSLLSKTVILEDLFVD